MLGEARSHVSTKVEVSQDRGQEPSGLRIAIG